MNQSEARKHMTVVAAGFVRDHLKSTTFGRITFKPADVVRMVDPGYWSSHGSDSQMGGNHEFTMKYKLVSGMSYISLKLQLLMPEQIFNIVDARLFWTESGSASTSGTMNETKLEGFSFYEAITYRNVNKGFIQEARGAATEWYRELFNPLEDSDLGTELNDWETFTPLLRKDVDDSSLVIELLRMKNRNDETYDHSFLDPGIVEVNIISDHEIKVRWRSEPRGVFAMSKPEMPSNYGGWE